MKTDYTTGPWYTKPVGGDHGQHLVISENSGATVAVVYADNGDARLIAAAPDLLQSLRLAYTILSDVRNQWDRRDTNEGQRTLCILRDNIALATGRDAEDVQNEP